MAAVATAPPGVPPLPTRLRRALGALLVLARDRDRLDQVLVFTISVNQPTIMRRIEELAAEPEIAKLLRDRPRIDRAHVDFDALRALPDGTLGREYARFLDDHGISPEPFEALPDLGDERAAWFVLRLRQTHDLWHVLTGYTPDVSGEILLQAFTYAQLGAPSAALLALLGTVRYLAFRRGHFPALARAYRRGKATKPLATFRWEDHWEVPLTALRERLAVPA